MRVVFIFLLVCFLVNLQADESMDRDKEIYLTSEDCVFIKYSVPERGIVCSNYERAQRLSKRLDNAQIHKCSWGPFVVIGDYNGERIFVACAPVGSGAGLVFTELFVAGAKYIIRYGSDDVKSPPKQDTYLVKIVDEADNLVGFNIQSGVEKEEWGQSVFASSEIIKSLIAEAENHKISYEMRICHHLENYHGLRSPDKFASDRSMRLRELKQKLEGNNKPSSFDMETAVLFRVAKDFHAHAASVLQTVNKEDKHLTSYEGENKNRAIEFEEMVFFNYVLESLIRINLHK